MPSDAVTSDTRVPQDKQSSSHIHAPGDTVPSSPLMAEEEVATMAALAKKRSQQEMNGDATRDPSDNVHFSASPVEPTDSQTDKQPFTIPSTAAHTQPSSSTLPRPTPTPVSSMLPPAAVPPRSGQGNAKALENPAQTQQPAASQSSQPAKAVPATAFGQDDDARSSDETASNASTTTSDPQDKLEDFDWLSLQQHYHDRMSEIGHQEQAIFAEFNDLCNYFSVWADASRTHEVGRSFKRLKTQIAYVSHEEDELESKRQHYIKVVQAFQSALQLLGT